MATTARAQLRLTRERLFYSGMALFIFALVVIGFAPTWFMRGAFETARRHITVREKAERHRPSHPQGHFGPLVESKLPELEAQAGVVWPPP